MKKILSVILASGMILSCSAMVEGAATAKELAIEDAVINTIDEPTPEMMEQMIKKVRPLIDVPEEYTEFNWDFHGSNSYSNAYWNFFWSDNVKGEVNVTCDTEGRITGYYIYDYKSERKANLPSVSPEELLPKAKEFIGKTAPYLKDMDLRLSETSYPDVFYNHAYTYVFTRYENDIPVPENTVRVSVNHITKEVESMNVSVNADIKFEKPEKLISEDEAKSAVSKNQKMNLSYRLANEYDDDGNLVSRKAYLIYSPEVSYLSADAENGKVYTERNTWNSMKGSATINGATGGIMMDNSASKEESADSEEGEYRLSEQELEQLQILESLISKDDATNVILKDADLYKPENAYLSNARLTKRYFDAVPLSENGEKQEKYVWNLYFSTPGEMYLGMNATVDAHDGKLISFSSDLPSVYHYEEFKLAVPELRISKEQAIELASEFIKKHEPEKFKSVKYSSDSEYATFKYNENENGDIIPEYRANRIVFVRQNEGVDFTYNSFNLGVDRATGKITRFSYSWYDDVKFESPKDIISPEDAMKALYADNGFGLNYEVNCDYTYVEGKYDSVESNVYSRAVYSLFNPHTTTVRAIDGKLINYNNVEIIISENDGVYADMQNHWAKDTVKRFSWIGYGPEGDSFTPNAAITGEDFAILCETVRIYGNTEDVLKMDSLSRMQAVKLIIDYLGYGKIAKLENVFITDFSDNSDFLPEDIGYAAIARGFGLIEGDGENFRPYDTLTRAEALTIIENVIDLGVLDN